MRRIVKYILRTVTVLILIVLLLLASLTMPIVQTFIVSKVTKSLSKQLETTISIDKVKISFFDQVSLKGVYLEDQSSDTLLFADRLDVDIAMFQLFQKNVSIERINLESSVIHVNQLPDSTFNFSFIIDAFAPSDTSDTTSSGFTVNIDELWIEQADYQFDLIQAKNHLKFDNFLVEMNAMNLDDLAFDVEKINLDKATISSIWVESLPSNKTSVSLDSTATSTIPFPLDGLPISILCKEISISETNAIYKKGVSYYSDVFNPNNVSVSNFNVQITDIEVNDTLGKFDISNSQLVLNDNQVIDGFNVAASLSPNNISLESKPWKYNDSSLDFIINSSFKSFNDLANLKADVEHNLYIDSTNIAVSDVLYFVPQLNEVASIQTLENQNILLSLQGNGTLKNTSIQQFYVQALETELTLKGVLKNLDDINKLAYDQLQFDLSTNTKNLRAFLGTEIIPKSYDRFGKLELKGKKVEGNLNDLNFENLNLSTNSAIQVDISGKIRSLQNIDALSYDLNIAELSAGYQEVKAFSNEIPELLSPLKKIKYIGKAKGNLNTFDIDGKWISNLGNLTTDLFLDFNKDYSNASYNGQLSIDNFQLGELLNNDSLGALTLQASFDGQGLQIEDIHSTLNAEVKSITFNSYNYQNLAIDGKFDQKKFDGKLAINDENLAFDFNGLVNLQDSTPSFNFDAQLDNINTQALNLTTFPLKVKLKIDSDISGKTLNDLDGKLSLKEVELTNAENRWYEDSIVLLAENKVGLQRDLHLNASFIQLDMTGKFEVENLTKILMAFGDQHFPFSSFIGPVNTDDAFSDSTLTTLKDENIKIDLRLTQAPELASFFNIDLKRLDSLTLNFSLDAPTNLLDFKFFIPHLDYQDIHVDSIYAEAGTVSGDLLATFSIDSASMGESIYIPGLGIDAGFKDQKAVLSTYIENDTGGYSLQLLTDLTGVNDHVGIQINTPLTLNTRQWNVQQTNDLLIFGDSLYLPNVSISNQDQSLSFAKINEAYQFNFQEFDLNNLVELVEIDSFKMTGLINGDLNLDKQSNAAAISGKLSLNDLTVNESTIGNLEVDAEKILDEVKAKIILSGADNKMSLGARYNIIDQDLEGKLNVEKISLQSFEAFVQAYVSDLDGYISGSLNINGSTEDPKFDGQISFKDTKAKVKALGTQYGVSDGNVKITEKLLTPALILVDEENRKAKLGGTISHDIFQEMAFDLNIQTDKFTFLNSKKDAEALFYGKLIGSMQASIQGDLTTPKIRGNLNTLSESDITVQLLSTKAVASQENYVVFLNGADYSKEEIDSIANSRYQISSNIDVNLLLNIDQQTTLNVIIDPLTGDNLQLNGSGQLAVKIPPRGDIDITGIYTVNEGMYNFSFQKFLKRKFEIVNGSQLVFSGNPLNAQLNITAAYNTEASVYALVQDQSASLSNEEERELKKKEDVSVALLINGKLSEPKLSFDINLDSQGNSPIGNSAKRSLDQIKQNESELNKQVFSLLLFNSFTGSSNAGNLSTTGTSTAVRSVGNLISNQLNRLASKADGLQIDFDLDQYQNQFSDNNSQITEIDLGISQSLLNDRLLISVGGNVDLESGNQSEGALGNVAGDFVIEYKLTNDGKYKIRVFQKSDFDALNDANLWKTGAGFTYQTKFGKLRKKKKEND